jgi:hypothetical protein
MIQLKQETCGDLEVALRREWLETNGLGGFASWRDCFAGDEHYSVTTVIVEQILLCLSSATDRASTGTTILESKRTELTTCPPTQEPSVFQQVLVHSILRPSTTVARIIWNVNYSA